MFTQSPIDYMLFGKPESHKIERKEKKEEGTRKVKEDQAQREAERLRKIEADRKMRTGLKSGLIAQQMLARKHVENALAAVRTRLQNAMDDVRVVGEIAKDIDAMCHGLVGGARRDRAGPMLPTIDDPISEDPIKWGDARWGAHVLRRDVDAMMRTLEGEQLAAKHIEQALPTLAPQAAPKKKGGMWGAIRGAAGPKAGGTSASEKQMLPKKMRSLADNLDKSAIRRDAAGGHHGRGFADLSPLTYIGLLLDAPPAPDIIPSGDDDAGQETLGRALGRVAELCYAVHARYDDHIVRPATSGAPGATHVEYTDSLRPTFGDRDHDHSHACGALSAAGLATRLSEQFYERCEAGTVRGLQAGQALRACAHTLRFADALLRTLGPSSAMPRPLRRAAWVLQHVGDQRMDRSAVEAANQENIDELEVETHRRKKMVGNPKRQAVKRESMRVVRSTRVFNDHLLA